MVGKSQQTRVGSLLPCLCNLFHERITQCVYLCQMFAIQNEPVAKKALLTDHNLQWRGPKVKMA